MTDRSTFEIRLLRGDDASSGTDEAVVIINDRDALATLGRTRWRTWIGRSPDKIVGATSDLWARRVPRHAFVAVCDCGTEDCGALVARIARVGDTVVWDQFRSGSDSREVEAAIDVPAVRFDAAAYDAALQAPTLNGRWQPTSRSVAARITRDAMALDLSGQRLRAGGCGHRGDDEVCLTAFLSVKGDADYSLLRMAFSIDQGDEPEATAQRVLIDLVSGRFAERAERSALPIAAPVVAGRSAPRALPSPDNFRSQYLTQATTA